VINELLKVVISSLGAENMISNETCIFREEELKYRCTKRLKPVFENQGFLSMYSALYSILLWDRRNSHNRRIFRLPCMPEREL